MRFEIIHTTRYGFDRSVFLEPHRLRLHPRRDGGQHVERFAYEIEPAPAGLTESLDAENNLLGVCWFSELTATLTVTARSVVHTTRPNAFDYILPAEAMRLPLSYPEALAAALGLSLRRADPPDAGEEDPVAAFTRQLLDQTDRQTLPFLTALTDRLYERTEVVIRDEGEPCSPAETLRTTVGACRDLTVLFMDCCRVAGLAARFVSGYQEGDPDQRERHLHAWPEVYLPLAGWRGFDPTHGLAVSDRHVAVASSHHPVAAMPVTGTFRGTDATSRMSYKIEMTVQDTEEAARF
jgi:transglutaminase-like putative cysteine protease